VTRFRLASAAVLLALLGTYACGGDGIVLPDDSLPAEIAAFDGDGQIAPVGTTLSTALVVEVTDAQGRAVSNQQVSFSVTEGGGQVQPGTARTDANGRASTSWTLGPSAGAQRLRAQATGGGAPADLMVDFQATALAGSGSTLVLVSGDAQSAPVGAQLDQQLVVRVVDPLGNPVSGQTVSWSVVGGGSIDPASSVTGDDGQASATRILGPTAGTQSALATAEGLAGSPVTFTHTAGASTPTTLEYVSGDGQSAPAGFQLPESLVVRLRDANGNGAAGRTVTWVVAPSAGVVDPVNSVTDADGFAVTRWTLGATAGNYTLNAVFSGLPSIPFSATATADAPATLALASGDGQTAAVGTTLSAPLRVVVKDANGNPVANVGVTWSAGGGGSVSSSSTGTDAQGIAQVTRTLGPTPGTYTTTATVAGLAGSPVTFSSTAVVGAAARLAFLTQPASVQVGQTLPAFQVEIQDAQGNRVTTANNQVAITSNFTGTLNGDNTKVAVAGVATFDGLSVDEARTGYRFVARASGLENGASEEFEITKGGTTVEITGRSPTGSVAGQSVSITYRVLVVAPAAGGPSGTVTVSDGTQSCTGGVNAGTGAGNCSIQFATAGDHQLTATYSGDGNFNGSASEAQTHAVGKANTNLSITRDDSDPSVFGQAITVEYGVSVSSPGGGTPSGNVVISVSGGAETCTGTVTAGSCTLTLSGTGDRVLTAAYAGDANYNGDTDTEGHRVNQAQTTTTITGQSTGTSLPGESYQVSVSVQAVAPGGGTPQGSFTVSDGEGGSCGGTLDGSGAGSCSLSSATAGTKTLTATYTPSANHAGSSGTATHEVNTPPAANPDAFSVSALLPDTVEEPGVLANDGDADGDPIQAVLDTDPVNGSVLLFPNGSFFYTPNPLAPGPDTFTYHVTDGKADSPAVTVTVNPEL
jgi:large repetitive protein